MHTDKALRIRLALLTGVSAALLSGCVTIQPDSTYQPLRNMTDTRPVERPRIAMAALKERYPVPTVPPRFNLQQATGLFDEAVAANSAIGNSAPDGRFRFFNTLVWYWVSEGGDVLIAEGEGEATVQYLFAADTDTPAFILTQSAAYTFADSELIGAFTPAGRSLSPVAFAAEADAAQHLMIRGRALFFASLEPAPEPDYVRRDDRSATLVTYSTWLLPTWSGFDPDYDRYRQRRESRNRHGRWEGERRRRHDRDRDGHHDGRIHPGGPGGPRHDRADGSGAGGGGAAGQPGRPRRGGFIPPIDSQIQPQPGTTTAPPNAPPTRIVPDVPLRDPPTRRRVPREVTLEEVRDEDAPLQPALGDNPAGGAGMEAARPSAPPRDYVPRQPAYQPPARPLPEQPRVALPQPIYETYEAPAAPPPPPPPPPQYQPERPQPQLPQRSPEDVNIHPQ